MDMSTNKNTSSSGTPLDNLNWSEPAFSNNISNGRYCGLKRRIACSMQWQIWDLLNVDSFVIKSSVNGRKFPILTNEDLSWKWSNVVYVITCKVCLKQYVGETSQKLQDRMNGHKRGIRHGQTEGYRHFRWIEDHQNKEIAELISVQIAEKIFDSDGANENVMKPRCLEREFAWICRLQSTGCTMPTVTK